MHVVINHSYRLRLHGKLSGFGERVKLPNAAFFSLRDSLIRGELKGGDVAIASLLFEATLSLSFYSFDSSNRKR
jgi:hypothetical protein